MKKQKLKTLTGKGLLRTIRFRPETYAQLKAYAGSRGREIWFLVNEICEEYLRREVKNGSAH